MQSPMRALLSAPLFAVITALVVAFAPGCRSRDVAPAPTATPPTATPIAPPTAAVEIIDDAGRAVRLPALARRIVSLAPSHTEIIFAIGAGDRLVGRTPACDFPPVAAAVAPIGDLFPPAYERILGAAPDLVLMTDGSLDVRHRLEKQGLTVAVLHPRTLAEVAGAMRRIGVLAGVDAEPVAARFEAALAAASRPVGPDAPRVFYEVGFEPLYGAGPASFVGDLIRRAGGQNALGGEGEWPRLDTEQLIAADPTVIVVGNARRRDAILADPPAGWAALRAVRDRRVIAVPDADLFVRPGPRVVEGLVWLAAEIEP